MTWHICHVNKCWTGPKPEQLARSNVGQWPDTYATSTNVGLVSDLTHKPYQQMLDCSVTRHICQPDKTCQIKCWIGQWPDKFDSTTNVGLVRLITIFFFYTVSVQLLKDTISKHHALAGHFALQEDRIKTKDIFRTLTQFKIVLNHSRTVKRFSQNQ